MSASRVPLIALLITIALLLVNGLASYRSLAIDGENDRLVAQSYQVSAQLITVLSSIKDAETGQRGYLLTGRPEYLEPYEDALGKVLVQVDELKRLTADNAGQQEKAGDLSRLIDRRLDLLRRTVALRKAGQSDEARRLILDGEGKRRMDEIRKLVADMDAHERENLAAREAQSRANRTFASGSLAVATLIGACMVGLVFLLGRRHAHASHLAAATADQQREQFRVTLASIGDAVIVTDEAGRVSFMNAVAQSLTGWAESDAVGRPLEAVFRILHESTRRPVESPVTQAMRDGRVVGLANHTVLVARDGTERAIADTAAPIRQGDGPMQGVVLVFHDVTERRWAERALAASEQRYDLAVRGSNDGIWDWDVVHSKNYFSDRCLEMWGCVPGETPQTYETWAGRIHPDDADRVTEALRRHLEERQPYDVEYRGRTEAGEWRWFRSRGQAVWDDQGKPLRMAGSMTDVTDRRRIEERLLDFTQELEREVAERTRQLRDSERRFRAVFNSQYHFIGVLSLDGVLLEVNQAALTVGGIQKEDVVGKPFWDAIWWRHDEAVRQRHRETVARAAAGEQVRFESTYVTLDGALRWVDHSLTPFRDESGKVVFIIPEGFDVTEQKRSKRRLEVQHAVAQALAGSADEAEALPRLLEVLGDVLGWDRGEWWTLDADAGVLRCALDWQADADGLPGFREATHGFAFARGQGLPGEVWQSGEPAWAEDVTAYPGFLRADAAAAAGLHGAVAFPVESVVTGVVVLFSRWAQPPDAELLFAFRVVAGQYEQFSRRRRAEASLREGEERFRSAFEFAPIGLALVSPEGRWLRVNRSLCEIVGYSESELLATDFQTITHPDDLDGDLSQAGELLAGGIKTYQLEKRYFHKRGHVVHILLSVSLVRDNAGEPVYFISQIQDVSQRKQAEAEVYKAKEAAEAASRAKSDFLANMSHEIRTPMNGIMGMADLALDTDLTGEQREFIATVKSSAESLLGVINDVLDFSKIEAGKLELDPHPFSLRDGLGDMLKPLAFRAHKKGLELACAVTADVPDALVGDLGRLRQVLLNLVGNAIKFTDSGEVVVRAEIDEQGDGWALLHFSVIDTGVGIPQDKLHSIFEPFTQADASTTRKYGGTGLGLTISSSLVELMGGRVWAESQPGQGSTFHFTARFEVRPDDRPANRHASMEGLPVLVADDSLTSCLILADMLSAWRMKPAASSDLAGAVAELGRAEDAGEPFAVMLLDASLAGDDGRELLRRLRTGGTRLGVVLLSSADRAEAKAWEGLAESVVTKPPKQSDLYDAILAAAGLPAREGEARRSVVEVVLPASRPLRVLLAEDNPVNQLVGQTLLEKRGHDVTLVANGREAVEAVERETFDVVLMDMQMPEMGGLEATAAIREREGIAGGHVRIIALTANAMKGDRERCLAGGMDGYLSKPLRQDELWAVLDGGTGDPAAVDSRAPFVMAEAMGRVGHDVRLLKELTELFATTSAASLTEIDAALTAGDARCIERAAHSLKGASGVFGAWPVAEAAAALEKLGAAGDLSGGREALARLSLETARLLDAFASLGEGRA